MPEHNPVEEIFEGIMETINDHIPKNKSVRFLEEDNRSPISAQMNKFNKLLGRQNTIHGVFGGGKCEYFFPHRSNLYTNSLTRYFNFHFHLAADVILWRNKKISSGIMVAATAIWVLFELLEYHFLTLACFSLVIGMVIQFVWTNASYLMNRYIVSYLLDFMNAFLCLVYLQLYLIESNSPSSSVPRLVLPRDMFANVGACLDTEVNRFLCFLQDVTSGKDLKHFVFVCFYFSAISHTWLRLFKTHIILYLQIVSALWVAAVIGSYCNFVTVIYIGIRLFVYLCMTLRMEVD